MTVPIRLYVLPNSSPKKSLAPPESVCPSSNANQLPGYHKKNTTPFVKKHEGVSIAIIAKIPPAISNFQVCLKKP